MKHIIVLIAGCIVVGIVRAQNHPAGIVKPIPSEVVQLWAGDDPPGLVTNARPEKVVRLLNDQGITVFGLKYRTRYGKNDVEADALADGKRAVRLVRSRAAQWNIDPKRVGVQGYSAGANLCLNLISHFDEGNTNATDAVERLSSRPHFCVLMCPWPNGKTLDHFPLGPQVPPTWIASARDDTTAPLAFSQAIDDKLKALGAVHELFIVESGGHGAFHYGIAKGPGSQWPEPFFGWLKKIGMVKGEMHESANASMRE
jgi:predicted esterase